MKVQNNIVLNSDLDSLESSFRDGCNAIVNKCISLGVTPISNSPTDICLAIDEVYNKGKSLASVIITAKIEGGLGTSSNSSSFTYPNGGTVTASHDRIGNAHATVKWN